LIQINPKDNVAVTLSQIVTAAETVPPFHKTALLDIKKGEPIIKYGALIGVATADIKAGCHIHTHNIKTCLNENPDYIYAPATGPINKSPAGVFNGFRRWDGRVGIRNEIWIIPTVGCVNSIGSALAQEANKRVRGNVTGAYCLCHPHGCSQLGDDHENTKKILCALANHPNAGGVLILGLGCENNSVAGMKEALGDTNNERIKFMVCQEYKNENEKALELIDGLIERARDDAREPVLTSELIVGLKCGGSDGLSGVTANPLLGMFTDRLINEGGSAILTEVPEMFGAETILMNRCVSEKIFNKTVSLINDFKAYYTSLGQPVYENPSPGNKAGGISTLEEKSLGAIQKAGTSPVTDVLNYGDTLKIKGLNLLQAPGNDIVASTALAAGAHLIMFTTGRGTPLGAPVPVVKISSNTELFENKPHWIDFNAGEGIAENISIEDLKNRLYDFTMDVASGKTLTKSEIMGCRDMAVFKTGATL